MQTYGDVKPVAVDGAGAVGVAWLAYNASYSPTIYFSRSTNAGSTWTAPAPALTFKSGDDVRDANLTFSPTGKALLDVSKRRDHLHEGELRARSAVEAGADPRGGCARLLVNRSIQASPYDSRAANFSGSGRSERLARTHDPCRHPPMRDVERLAWSRVRDAPAPAHALDRDGLPRRPEPARAGRRRERGPWS